MLKQFSTDRRLSLAELLVCGYNSRGARRKFYEEFPDEHEYSEQTFYNYSRSNQYNEDREKVQDHIKERISTMPMVVRGNRITVLVEVLENLLERFRAIDYLKLDIPTRDLATLSGEIRQVLSSIKEESIPYDSDAVAEDSPWAAFGKVLDQLTPEVTGALDLDTALVSGAKDVLPFPGARDQ